MNLREKFVAAQAERRSSMSYAEKRDIELNKVLLTFAKDIPQLMDSALLLLQAGEDVRGGDVFFRKHVLPPLPWQKAYKDANSAIDSVSNSRGVRQLKAYLSDPAVDMAFSLEIWKPDERSVEQLMISLAPEKPFAQSKIIYRSHIGVASREMTDEDRNAWTASLSAKPKMAVPAKLARG